MMASEPFVFHGRSLRVWDHFDATPAEAKTLVAHKYAVVRPKRYQTSDLRPDNTPTDETIMPPVTRKRAYRRRDMKAETH